MPGAVAAGGGSPKFFEPQAAAVVICTDKESNMAIDKNAALQYHREHVGKIALARTVSCRDREELALVYTPGVAFPCQEIAARPEEAYAYTSKGNLVAVVSNGTAVLGLGDIGGQASMPVMEGKCLLFKMFADVDAFPICVTPKAPDDVAALVEHLEPTFGGVNLEDIKAPECFQIEERLRKTLDIPVFHDDQHGTAIVCAAGLMNALKLAGKDIESVRVCMNGAGAAGLAVAKMIVAMGAPKEHIVVCDSRGPITKARGESVGPYKAEFAQDADLRTLADAMAGADVFIGVSVADCVTPDMLRSMADRPIAFTMANPNPEIAYDLARASRPDLLLSTGRSDYPNQVNNLLAFPGVFRGALDTRASEINEAMKLAAAKAIAGVIADDELNPDYFIPSALDRRVARAVARAVAQAAMDSGAARRPLDADAYAAELEKRLPDQPAG